MAILLDLEARMEYLENIEAIKKLKSKYLNCIDKKLLNEVVSCFSEDATADYGAIGYGQFQGLEEITHFFEDVLSLDHIAAIHQAHNPEIEVIGEAMAKGTWEVYLYVIDAQANTALRMAGFYEDEYAKEKGQWKIKKTKGIRIFVEKFERG